MEKKQRLRREHAQAKLPRLSQPREEAATVSPPKETTAPREAEKPLPAAPEPKEVTNPKATDQAPTAHVPESQNTEVAQEAKETPPNEVQHVSILDHLRRKKEEEAELERQAQKRKEQEREEQLKQQEQQQQHQQQQQAQYHQQLMMQQQMLVQQAEMIQRQLLAPMAFPMAFAMPMSGMQAAMAPPAPPPTAVVPGVVPGSTKKASAPPPPIPHPDQDQLVISAVNPPKLAHYGWRWPSANFGRNWRWVEVPLLTREVVAKHKFNFKDHHHWV